jgi:hypothetical protein
MAKAKEFTVTIDDKPGALGKCFLALAERGVNILAFQSYVEEGESLARLQVDDPAIAMEALNYAVTGTDGVYMACPICDSAPIRNEII